MLVYDGFFREVGFGNFSLFKHGCLVCVQDGEAHVHPFQGFEDWTCVDFNEMLCCVLQSFAKYAVVFCEGAMGNVGAVIMHDDV